MFSGNLPSEPAHPTALLTDCAKHLTQHAHKAFGMDSSAFGHAGSRGNRVVPEAPQRTAIGNQLIQRPNFQIKVMSDFVLTNIQLPAKALRVRAVLQKVCKQLVELFLRCETGLIIAYTIVGKNWIQSKFQLEASLAHHDIQSRDKTERKCILLLITPW